MAAVSPHKPCSMSPGTTSPPTAGTPRLQGVGVGVFMCRCRCEDVWMFVGAFTCSVCGCIHVCGCGGVGVGVCVWGGVYSCVGAGVGMCGRVCLRVCSCMGVRLCGRVGVYVCRCRCVGVIVCRCGFACRCEMRTSKHNRLPHGSAVRQGHTVHSHIYRRSIWVRDFAKVHTAQREIGHLSAP